MINCLVWGFESVEEVSDMVSLRLIQYIRGISVIRRQSQLGLAVLGMRC
jgi:hypothetical protein